MDMEMDITPEELVTLAKARNDERDRRRGDEIIHEEKVTSETATEE